MFVPIRRDPIPIFREKSYSDASALQKNVSVVESFGASKGKSWRTNVLRSEELK
jgi:hypothetical protein